MTTRSESSARHERDPFRAIAEIVAETDRGIDRVLREGEALEADAKNESANRLFSISVSTWMEFLL